MEKTNMTVTIRPLKENDLAIARSIIPLAFGTFLGAAEPEKFWADLDYAGTRWRADPSSAFGAEMDGELVGSNFATRWGSVGFFGPLTVRPGLWDQGVGKRLMEPIMECFERWKVTHAGLFTFAQSAKHIGLYQKFGFWPRFLTAIMSKPVQPIQSDVRWINYSEILEGERDATLKACGRLTDALYAGLNVEREIRAVHTQGLGETLLLWNDRDLAGFAVCHFGPGTEAGRDKCYVKFGAVQDGPTSGPLFDRLLDACEGLASSRGIARLEAGVNLARHEAYHKLRARGFRTDIQGVAMHRPNEPGYNRPGVYLIDDWR
jgi:GNAT superfamily N-acetyltransferase